MFEDEKSFKKSEEESERPPKRLPEPQKVHSHSLFVQKLFCVDLTCEGISSKKAYEWYENYLNSREIKPILFQEFGKLIAEVFPEKHMVTKKRRVAIPGTRIRESFYENLKIRSEDQQLDEQSNNKTPMEDMVNKAQEQKLVPDKWFCTLSTETGAEFVRLENSTKVLGKLTISQSLEWKLDVSGIEVKKEYFSDMNKVQQRVISSAKDLQAVLIACDKLSYCSGCTNPEYCSLSKIAFNSKGGESGFTEEISNGQEIKRSTGCQIVISPKSRGTMCTACQQLNSNLRVALYRFKGMADTAPNESGNQDASVGTKNWKYLTDEQQKSKQFDERRRRRNSEKREQYTKRRLLMEREMIKLESKDSKDVQQMFLQLDKGVDADGEELTFNDSMEWTEEAAFFWKLQRDVCTSGRPVWHPRFLEVCLRLWERSKEGYEELRDTGFMKLPSGRHLRYIKNKVVQKPGLHKKQIDWMIEEKVKRKVTEAGCNGYLVFDEMAIQGDLQLRRDGDCFELAGLVRLGELNDTMKLLQTGKNDAQMASHILQFTFVGCEGFQFPVAYYPTDTVDPVTLFHLYWEIVGILVQWGFFVHLGVCDGAQANRAFILAHFEDENDAIESGFTTINPYTRGRHTFMMDPPHNFKKLRNNLEKSSTSGKTPRHFQYEGKDLLWKHLYDAFCYDHGNRKGISTFQRLSEEHFSLTSSSRMRNYLADDVLGSNMLEVLVYYKEFLQDETTGSGTEIATFDKTIEFLNNTSVLLKNFKSNAPYRSSDDSRLCENTAALNWFIDWRKWVNEQDVPAKTKDRMFLSKKTMFDLTSMVLGFRSYCETLFMLFPGCDIKTSRTNQDGLEQFFGRQRAQNGQNNNPTELQYGASINSIVHLSSRMSVSRGNTSTVDQRR